jgi:hypothetical protein
MASLNSYVWKDILDFDRIKDGRGAWLAMCNHYEGDSFRNRSKEEAYMILDHLHYEGERKGFTFEKLIEKHNECYLEKGAGSPQPY